MKKGIRNMISVVCMLITCIGTVCAQFIDFSDERVKTPLEINLKQIGTMTPRMTKEIKSSRITIGCEVLDRNLADFDQYKAYLPYLGAKKARIQAGWAKCERTPGVYDWKWLDDIINFLVANDMEPWFELSYGNPAYAGGGGTGLLNSLMTSEEGYRAWDRWVEAAVTRYKDRVTEWEIWNEPDHPMQEIAPETTAELNIRTADIIKRIQPEAEIAGLAFASNSDKKYLDRFLKRISDKGKLSLFNWISYHSYNMRPEDAYRESSVLGLREVINKYSPAIKLRQGENGAPSTFIPDFALSKYYWTEYTQAKYDMRRLLGDLGHDIETSVFTIIDIYYNPVINTKGLILSDTTKAAIRPKVAYYAVQNLTAVFDDDMRLNPEVKFSHNSQESLALYAYKHDKTNLVALWNDSKEATNSFLTNPVDLTVENCTFKEPVWVDLMTGKVYEIPSAQWKNQANGCTFTGLPVYDSPVLVCEKNFILRDAADSSTEPVIISEGRVIHRFFDTSPISPSGKYIALFRMPYEDKSPQPGDCGEVVVIDLITKQEVCTTQTRGWEMQLGANVQWGSTDDDLFYNDVDTVTWEAYAVRFNFRTGKKERINGTVFMVSPDGNKLASYDLRKSRFAQVGYGVVVPDDQVSRNVGPVNDDGVYVTDLTTGQCRLIASIRDIYEQSKPSIAIPDPENYAYYCFQVKWNPQGTRLLTTIQWASLKGGERRRAVITMKPDGSDIRTAVTPDQWSMGGHHINWMPDGNHLSMNLNIDGEKGIEIISVKDIVATEPYQ